MALIKVEVEPQELLVYLDTTDIIDYLMYEGQAVNEMLSSIDDDTIIEHLRDNGYTIGKEL